MGALKHFRLVAEIPKLLAEAGPALMTINKIITEHNLATDIHLVLDEVSKALDIARKKAGVPNLRKAFNDVAGLVPQIKSCVKDNGISVTDLPKVFLSQITHAAQYQNSANLLKSAIAAGNHTVMEALHSIMSLEATKRIAIKTEGILFRLEDGAGKTGVLKLLIHFPRVPSSLPLSSGEYKMWKDLLMPAATPPAPEPEKL